MGRSEEITKRVLYQERDARLFFVKDTVVHITGKIAVCGILSPIIMGIIPTQRPKLHGWTACDSPAKEDHADYGQYDKYNCTHDVTPIYPKASRVKNNKENKSC